MGSTSGCDMDKKTGDQAQIGLAKLVKAVDDGDIVIFTVEEANAIREVAKTWVQLKAVVALGGTLGGFMKWAVLFAASYFAIKAGLIDWLRDGLKG